MRRLTWVVCLAMVASSLLVAPALSMRTEKVIYDDGKGNALIAIGGTKDGSGDTPSQVSRRGQARSLGSPDQTLLAIAPEERLIQYHAWGQTPFGDSAVTVEFWADLWQYMTLEIWATVDGETYTGWWGAVPQYYSDKINLADAWKFSGLSVTVSIPAGAGFSVIGTTAKWAGGYDGGDAYDLWHIYSGIEAQTWYYLSSMRQTSSGDHFFRTTMSWVSKTVSQGKSLL